MNHLAVIAKRDAATFRERPQEAALRLARVVAVHVRILTRVTGGHRLLAVVGHVRGSGPDVPLRADLGISEEAVEEAEAPRQRVMVRGDGDVGEVDEAGVAVTLLHVAEHLIVGAILFDDVDHVLERWIASWRRLPLPIVRGGNTPG